LERNGREDMIMANIHTLGAMSIARQEHPRRLETMLNTILSPADRIDYFD
jgi:chemotaxis protein MotA